MLVNTEEILNDIDKKVFQKDPDLTVNVFLCGSGEDNEESLRSLIYKELKDKAKVNIVFPEWLFSDLLAKSDYNLLQLEHELGQNVDLIVLPLESPGTIAELGAFASNDSIRDKMLVINSEEYRKDRHSFIYLGPIRLITKENQHGLMFYDPNNKQPAVAEVASRVKYMRKRTTKSDINNLFNLSRFMLFVIGIYQPVGKIQINEMLMNWSPSLNEHYIDPCLKILLKSERILVKKTKNDKVYSLTDNGHKYVFENVLPNLHVIREFGNIRTRVMNRKYRGKRGINLSKERERLLEKGMTHTT